jgi:hypothetical protein
MRHAMRHAMPRIRRDALFQHAYRAVHAPAAAAQGLVAVGWVAKAAGVVAAAGSATQQAVR